MGIIGKKWLSGGIAGLAVLAVIFLGYRHYTKLQENLGHLRESQGQLQAALDLQRQSVRTLEGVTRDWAQSQAALGETLERMQEESNVAREEARRVRESVAGIGAHPPAVADSLADAAIARLWAGIADSTRGDQSRRGHGADPPGAPAAPGAGAPPVD